MLAAPYTSAARCRPSFATAAAETHVPPRSDCSAALFEPDRRGPAIPWMRDRSPVVVAARTRWNGRPPFRRHRRAYSTTASLHSETMSQYGKPCFAARSGWRQFCPRRHLAEPAGHQNRRHAFRHSRHPDFSICSESMYMDFHPALGVHTGVDHRFGQRLVGLGQVDVTCRRRRC